MNDFTAHLPSSQPGWIKVFARIGLFANGLVYCLVGWIAFTAAFELNGNSTSEADKDGVLKFILEKPFGKIILVLVALGLAFYSLWRILQAIKDTEGKGNDLKGLGKRVAFLFSGIIYGGLAFAAFKLATGIGSSSSSDGRETIARTVLAQPLGQWLLGLAGAGVIISGLYQIYRGVSEKYKKNTDGSHLKHETETMLIRAGKVGYIARGIVWMLIGYFFIQAALHTNPSEAGGTSQAFKFMEGTFGSVLLGAVAIGLICYGGYMFMRAKYQPIKTS